MLNEQSPFLSIQHIYTIFPQIVLFNFLSSLGAQSAKILFDFFNIVYKVASYVYSSVQAPLSEHIRIVLTYLWLAMAEYDFKVLYPISKLCNNDTIYI